MNRAHKLPALLSAGALAATAATALAATALLAGCSGDASDRGEKEPKVIKFGVPPGEADPELLDKMQPVADVVAEATGREVEVTKTSDYPAIVEAMRSGLLDVAMFSPMPTVVAQDVAHIKPLAAGLGAQYKTNIICRPDADVASLPDVGEHSIGSSTPAPPAVTTSRA